jgi:hypothetical protein
VKVTLCPAFNVTGRAAPVRVNPVPVAVACEIVTADPPEFVRVSFSDFVLPT